MGRRVLFILCAVLLSLAAKAAMADEDEQLLFQELPRLVSASRHVVSLVESPATASVLTREDIEHSAVDDITGLLRFVSGITMAMPHSSSVNIGMRGVNGQQANNVLVLVDGRPVYSPVRNNIQWFLIPVTLADVERVEVIRGPGSVLYGSHAFAGVINIVTRAPSELSGVEFFSRQGTFDSAEYGVLTGGRRGAVSYKLAASWEKLGNWADHRDYSSDLAKFSGELIMPAGGEGSLDLSWGGTQGALEVAPSAFLDFDQQGFEGFVRGRYSKGDLLMDLWWRRHETKGEWDGPRLKWQFDNVSYTLQRDFRWRSHDLVAGFEARWAKMRSDSYDSRHQQFLYSLFFEDRWRLGPDLDLFAGLRMDHHPLANEAYSPRISLVKMLAPNRSIRLTVAQAFKNPSYFQSYLDLDEGGFAQLGNRHLEQEKIKSIELAYRFWNPSGISLLAAAFYNKYVDVIDMVLDQEEGRTVLRVDNAYDGEQYGIEADLQWHPRAPWLLRLNYSYIWKERVRDATFGPVPTHQLNGELRYDWSSGYWLDLRVHWQDRADYSWGFATRAAALYPPLKELFPPGWQQTEAYTYGDLSAGYRPVDRRWSLSGAIHNLFHEQYRECPLGEEVPTTFTVRLTVGF